MLRLNLLRVRHLIPRAQDGRNLGARGTDTTVG